MKKELILLNLDGPYSNVLKFKPPLVFNKQNADELLEKLDKVLKETCSKSRLWLTITLILNLKNKEYDF